jgi:hypothetical protein
MGHAGPSNPIDPGFLLRIAKGGNMPIPAGWKDIGGILTSPNGVTTKGAVRVYILGQLWDGGDWLLSPLTAAVQPDPLDPTSGAGYIQITREHIVVSIRPVAPATTWKTYTRYAGEAGLALARQLVDANTKASDLQTQIAALQAQLATAQSAATASAAAVAAHDALAAWLKS